MRILKQHEIKQPTIGLIPEIPEIIEEELGAIGQDLGTKLKNKFGDSIKSLFPNNDASIFIEDTDLQRNQIFDPFDCVTASYLNAIYIIHQGMFGEIPLKRSRRYTAVKSGTIPNQGNSYSNVENSLIEIGSVYENDYVSITPTMTQNEFYQLIPSEIDIKENFKDVYDLMSYWIPRTNDGMTGIKATMFDFLAYSPIIVSVCGDYSFNNRGEIFRTSDDDTHAVLLLSIDSEERPYNLVLDSENPNGLVKFEAGYQFHYPKALFIKRKNMPSLYKKKGEPAIYFLNPADNLLVPYSDGVIDGGAMFKIYFKDYKFAPIQYVDELPYQIAPYSMTTVLTHRNLSAIEPEDSIT